ncbi:MAG: DUF1287 domain-containing protein [bacterium]
MNKRWTAFLAVAALMCCLAPAMSEEETPSNLLLVRAARAWVKMPCRYDGSYRKINYPAGDPGGRVGVCSDLVVRAYRALNIDLQVRVHQDMKKNFSAYPAKKLYDQTSPDTNIDHRRVPNLTRFLERHGQSLTLSISEDDLDRWRPGDIVVFDLLNNSIPSHIGIISDRKAESGLPLVIHHFPPRPSEDDVLEKWKITGHFRYFPDEGEDAGVDDQ